jgi:hypothetical protein
MGQNRMVAAACAWRLQRHNPNALARQTGLNNGFIDFLPLSP